MVEGRDALAAGRGDGPVEGGPVGGGSAGGPSGWEGGRGAVQGVVLSFEHGIGHDGLTTNDIQLPMPAQRKSVPLLVPFSFLSAHPPCSYIGGGADAPATNFFSAFWKTQITAPDKVEGNIAYVFPLFFFVSFFSSHCIEQPILSVSPCLPLFLPEPSSSLETLETSFSLLSKILKHP